MTIRSAVAADVTAVLELWTRASALWTAVGYEDDSGVARFVRNLDP